MKKIKISKALSDYANIFGFEIKQTSSCTFKLVSQDAGRSFVFSYNCSSEFPYNVEPVGGLANCGDVLRMNGVAVKRLAYALLIMQKMEEEFAKRI